MALTSYVNTFRLGFPSCQREGQEGTDQEGDHPFNHEGSRGFLGAVLEETQHGQGLPQHALHPCGARTVT